MNEKMTIKTVLVNTVNNLNGIMLPVSLLDTVGREIALNVKNLQVCLEAIERAEAEARAAAEVPAEETAGVLDAGEDEE